MLGLLQVLIAISSRDLFLIVLEVRSLEELHLVESSFAALSYGIWQTEEEEGRERNGVLTIVCNYTSHFLDSKCLCPKQNNKKALIRS